MFITFVLHCYFCRYSQFETAEKELLLKVKFSAHLVWSLWSLAHIRVDLDPDLVWLFRTGTESAARNWEGVDTRAYWTNTFRFQLCRHSVRRRFNSQVTGRARFAIEPINKVLEELLVTVYEWVLGSWFLIVLMSCKIIRNLLLILSKLFFPVKDHAHLLVVTQHI